MLYWSSKEEAMLQGHGTERAYLCQAHGDTNPSATINAYSGLYHCFVCGDSGKFDPDKIEYSPDSILTYVREVEEQIEAQENVGYMPEAMLDVYTALGPGEYWSSRFDVDLLNELRFGEDPSGKYATYPVRDSAGTLIGITRRDLTGTDRAKYRYPSGVSMGHHLFNYHRCTGETLLLVEGASDSVAAMEAGFNDCVAIYGSRLRPQQRILIARYMPSRVVLAFDSDEAGRRCAASTKQALQGIVPEVDELWWDGYKDLASIPLSDRKDLLSII